jgi:hypothetical protein
MTLVDILTPLVEYLNNVDFNPNGLIRALYFTERQITIRIKQLQQLRRVLREAAQVAGEGYSSVKLARRTEHWEENKFDPLLPTTAIVRSGRAEWQAEKARQLLTLLKEYTE